MGRARLVPEEVFAFLVLASCIGTLSRKRAPVCGECLRRSEPETAAAAGDEVHPAVPVQDPSGHSAGVRTGGVPNVSNEVPDLGLLRLPAWRAVGSWWPALNRRGSVGVCAGRPRPGPREGLSPPPDS
jgi:hypothetical protein